MAEGERRGEGTVERNVVLFVSQNERHGDEELACAKGIVSSSLFHLLFVVFLGEEQQLEKMNKLQEYCQSSLIKYFREEKKKDQKFISLFSQVDCCVILGREKEDCTSLFSIFPSALTFLVISPPCSSTPELPRRTIIRADVMRGTNSLQQRDGERREERGGEEEGERGGERGEKFPPFLEVFQEKEIVQESLLPAYCCSLMMRSLDHIFMQKRIGFIFDLDGVLGDTIESLFNVYVRFVERHRSPSSSLAPSRTEFEELNGPSLQEIVTLLQKKYDMSKEAPSSGTELLDWYRREIEMECKQTPLINGARDLLNLLHSFGIPIGLASSSSHSHIENFLSFHQLSSFFSVIVSGDDVKESKPSPEIYIIAKKGLPLLGGGKAVVVGEEERERRKFFVVEDSLNGVKAALGAGCQVFHLRSSPSQQEFPPLLPGVREIRSLHQIRAHLLEQKHRLELVQDFRDGCSLTRIQLVDEGQDRSGSCLSSKEWDQIEKVWSDALKTKPWLFNGKLLSFHCLQRIEDGGGGEASSSFVMEVKIVQYKVYFAQLTLSIDFGVRPIGVSGLIMNSTRDEILLAERFQVSQYQGVLEAPPSGSLTPETALFPEKQLLDELGEETSLSASSIDCVQLLCLTYDQHHRVFDLGYSLQMKGTEKIQDVTLKGEEYRNLQHVNQLQFEELIHSRTVLNISLTLCDLVLGWGYQGCQQK